MCKCKKNSPSTPFQPFEHPFPVRGREKVFLFSLKGFSPSEVALPYPFKGKGWG